MIKKISILILVYNEENTLKTLLKKVIDSDVCKLKKEIIIIESIGKSKRVKGIFSRLQWHIRRRVDGFGLPVFGFLGGISARPLRERPLHSF